LCVPAGALVDRWDRKRVMVVCDAARGLAMGSIPLAYTLGLLGMAQLYVAALIEGGAQAFFQAAALASLPRVVPAAHLTRAAGLNATAEAGTYLLGPGLAGMLIGLARTQVAGAALAYLLDGGSYLASLLTLRWIRLPFQQERGEQAGSASAPPPRAMRAEIAEGWHFLWSQRRLRAIVLFSSALALLDGPLPLALIVLAQRDLHAGARTIGLIFSLAGAGELVGSFIAPWVQARAGMGRALLGAAMVWALAMPLQATAGTPAMLIAGAALADMMLPIYNVAHVSYRLSLIPDELAGRVNGACRLPIEGSALIGTAAGGMLLAAYGPRTVLWLIGGGLLLSVLAASLTSLRRA
jgi:MFS family permease